ncbi:MAG TPA: phosphatase PAP2 family protein [Cyclobacteriaceae bacterium]|nr:phosphatase PAP2 family protein [Cyclobacteriaceae bacterium]
MKNLSFSILLTIAVLSASAQTWSPAPVGDHYKALQQFSGKPSPERAWMDTIKYPPGEYSNSIVYTLVKPYYLSDNQVKALSESVMFPANSSDQTRKELDHMLEIESRRTPEQIKRVEYLANIGYWPTADLLTNHLQYKQNLKDLFFEGRELIGERITAENLPKTAILLKGVMRDMRIMEFTIKYKLLRVRPYHLEPKLHALAKINSPSFASGHTLWAFTQAFTWSLVIPEKEKEFIALAEEIRRSREIMGIHFPSDNEAARQVAAQMIQCYLQNTQFQNDLKAAREEWKKVGASLQKK